MKRVRLQVMQHTIEEYVNVERFSNVKHEFVHGRILAMGGGTINHALLGGQVLGDLSPQLRRTECKMYNSELRFRIPDEDVIVYPDASIICGSAQTDKDDHLAAANPTVIIEVTSPSTALYDRGEKFGYYQLLPTLQEYVLVSHAQRLIEVFRRSPDGTWVLGASGTTGDVPLTSIGCVLNVETIYNGATGL